MTASADNRQDVTANGAIGITAQPTNNAADPAAADQGTGSSKSDNTHGEADNAAATVATTQPTAAAETDAAQTDATTQPATATTTRNNNCKIFY